MPCVVRHRYHRQCAGVQQTIANAIELLMDLSNNQKASTKKWDVDPGSDTLRNNNTTKELTRLMREPKSPSAAKLEIQAQGMTLKAWAEARGFKYRTVSEVVRGVNKGHYGEGHRVAVALGIK